MTTPYATRHIEAQLAEDDDVAELGIKVADTGDALVVSGSVASEQRRDRVLARVRQLAIGRPVVDEIRVTDHEVEEAPARSEVIE